jgi:hypothetical protein
MSESRRLASCVGRIAAQLAEQRDDKADCELVLQMSATVDRSKTERGTISIYFVAEAVRILKARDVPTEPLLERAGIPVKFLKEPLARVSPAQFSTLWTSITRALDDEFFGLDRHPMREVAMPRCATPP